MKRMILFLLAIVLSLSFAACKKDGPSSETTSGTTAQGGISETTAGTDTGELLHYDYVFDPYSLTWEYAELYGEEFVGVYKAFVDAYISYETSFSCPDEDTFYALFCALPLNMPYFSADAYLTFDCYDPATGTGEIYYTSASKEEHDALFSAFTGEIADIILGCLEKDDGELEKTLALYQAFSSSVKYMDSDDGSKITPYYALMHKQGICQSFAGAYTYLLLQAGVNANTCGGLTEDFTAAHEWSIVEIDGELYYMDTTFENGDTGGLGLSYFGMTTQERYEAGSFTPEYYNIGVTNEVWGKDYDVSDERFAPFRGCYYFSLDRENNRVAYLVTGDDTVRYFTY